MVHCVPCNKHAKWFWIIQMGSVEKRKKREVQTQHDTVSICYVCTTHCAIFLLKCIYMTSNFVNYLHIQRWLLHKITDSKSIVLLMIQTHVTLCHPTWNMTHIWKVTISLILTVLMNELQLKIHVLFVNRNSIELSQQMDWITS